MFDCSICLEERWNMDSQTNDSQTNSGPPYAPSQWLLGGTPKTNVDIPITAVLLVLYIIGAVTHMTIFQKNMRQGHKFIFSAVLFGFCFARSITCVLRISSTSVPSNIRLQLAAQIFVTAGVVAAFIINLFFTLRIIRSMHPRFGWSLSLSLLFRSLYVLVVCSLIMVVTATVQTYFTLDRDILHIDRALQLYGSTYFAVVSFLPLPFILISYLLPHHQPPEPFGAGRLSTKVFIVVTGATLLTLGAWYRAGTSYLSPVPKTQPLPRYFHRACFYVFNFVVEIMVVYFYAAMRIDRRFWIPNGAHGPGSYAEAGSSSASIVASVEEGGVEDSRENVARALEGEREKRSTSKSRSTSRERSPARPLRTQQPVWRTSEEIIIL